MRHYYKCTDCLSVLALDHDGYYGQKTACGACGGWLEHMGYVRRCTHDLAKMHTYCPCDGRCTSAIGPNCECQCGGENHGAGLLTEARIVGGVPTAAPSDDVSARFRAREYRELRAQAIAGAPAEYDADGRRRWLDSALAMKRRRIMGRVAAADKSRNHKNRIKALREAVAIGAGEVVLACRRMSR